MNIQKGAQYGIPFDIKMNGVSVTPDNSDGIRVQIADRLCEWPDGELEFDDTDNTWLYPLTETQSMAMSAGTLSAQISVKVGEDIFPSAVTKFKVYDSLITKRWD